METTKRIARTILSPMFTNASRSASESIDRVSRRMGLEAALQGFPVDHINRAWKQARDEIFQTRIVEHVTPSVVAVILYSDRRTSCAGATTSRSFAPVAREALSKNLRAPRRASCLEYRVRLCSGARGQFLDAQRVREPSPGEATEVDRAELSDVAT